MAAWLTRLWWPSCAQEPLSLRQLQALGFPDAAPALEDLRFLFAIDAEDRSRLHAYHSSVVDFVSHEPHLAGPLAADAREGHRWLFAVLLQELQERKDQAPPPPPPSLDNLPTSLVMVSAARYS